MRRIKIIKTVSLECVKHWDHYRVSYPEKPSNNRKIGKMKKPACHKRGTKKKSESPTGLEPMTSQTPEGQSIH